MFEIFRFPLENRYKLGLEESETFKHYCGMGLAIGGYGSKRGTVGWDGVGGRLEVGIKGHAVTLSSCSLRPLDGIVSNRSMDNTTALPDC